MADDYESPNLSPEQMGDLIKHCVDLVVSVLPKGIGFTLMLDRILPNGGLNVARATSLSSDALEVLLRCELSEIHDMGEWVPIQRRDN